jgi:hypothetical protein
MKNMTTKKFKEAVNKLYCDRDCDNVFVEVTVNGVITMHPVESIICDDDADWIIKSVQN